MMIIPAGPARVVVNSTAVAPEIEVFFPVQRVDDGSTAPEL
jgi:hypothetical protein